MVSIHLRNHLTRMRVKSQKFVIMYAVMPVKQKEKGSPTCVDQRLICFCFLGGNLCFWRLRADSLGVG